MLAFRDTNAQALKRLCLCINGNDIPAARQELERVTSCTTAKIKRCSSGTVPMIQRTQ